MEEKIFNIIKKYIPDLTGVQMDLNSHNIQVLLAQEISKIVDPNAFNIERYLDLCKKHKVIRETKNIIISVYTNASGYLWSICKVDSGTNLGWSNFHGNCEMSGTFKTYEDCLEDAITLIEKCDLERFKKEVPSSQFHWGNYAEHLNQNYKK